MTKKRFWTIAGGAAGVVALVGVAHAPFAQRMLGAS